MGGGEVDGTRPDATGGGGAGEAAIQAVHLYPTTMNTYGDRGNVITLTRRAEWRGIPLHWHEVELGQAAPPACDLLFVGGGQDRVQNAIGDDLRARRRWLEEVAQGGAAVLAVCAGLQLFGRRYVAADGSEIAGLGLLDLETVARRDRFIGNVVAEAHVGGRSERLAGFENHGGRTYLGQLEPLGRVLVGHGNNGEDGTEGAQAGTVFATYLHGPVLPRNAWLADHLLAIAAQHAGLAAAVVRPLDDGRETAALDEAIATAQSDTQASWRRTLRDVVAQVRRRQT
jgi:CobQ-like glutamine amidotransferase family enzyme